MKKAIAITSILLSALSLSACGAHHHTVKPKHVIIAPPVKHVVVVAPVKVKHRHHHKWH